MKQFKKYLVTVITFLMLTGVATPVLQEPGFLLVAEAHSGRTDSSGGHRDNKNVSGLGSYHYHCGGHPAHLHTGGKCPYASGGSSGNSTKKVKINKTSASLTEGKTLQLKIQGTSQKVKWSSDKKSIASVDSKGKVTAKKKGSAVITAKIGSKKYKCKITVKALAINKTKVTLEAGKSATLKLDTNKKIKWSSSNKNIAAVNAKGKVTAKKAGKATITAVVGKKKYKCNVTVTNKKASWKNKILISTVNFDPMGTEICFRITNNTDETITISGDLRAYDDDYEYFGSLELEELEIIKIRPHKTGQVTFTDFEDEELIYNTRRFIFEMKVGAEKTACYAEYTYDDKIPYKFTFK